MNQYSLDKPNKEFKQVEYRLIEWGRWLVRCYENGLGYPRRSTLLSAMEGSRSTCPLYPEDNHSAEEIHLIILKMAEKHPIWAKIVKIEYYEIGNKSQKDKASSLNISRALYLNLLSHAKSWIESAIS